MWKTETVSARFLPDSLHSWTSKKTSVARFAIRDVVFAKSCLAGARIYVRDRTERSESTEVGRSRLWGTILDDQQAMNDSRLSHCAVKHVWKCLIPKFGTWWIKLKQELSQKALEIEFTQNAFSGTKTASETLHEGSAESLGITGCLLNTWRAYNTRIRSLDLSMLTTLHKGGG